MHVSHTLIAYVRPLISGPECQHLTTWPGRSSAPLGIIGPELSVAAVPAFERNYLSMVKAAAQGQAVSLWRPGGDFIYMGYFIYMGLSIMHPGRVRLWPAAWRLL